MFGILCDNIFFESGKARILCYETGLKSEVIFRAIDKNRYLCQYIR